MIKKFIFILCFFIVACATPMTPEEKAEIIEKIDHEECIELKFVEGTEAYGGCRLTLKSIRAQNKTTAAIKRNGLDNRFCHRWYCW